MSRPASIFIDQDAFLHNIKKTREFAPNKIIMAVTKANGYGHGIPHLRNGLKFADAMGVSCLEEGMELREQGLSQPILLLEGFFNVTELPAVVANHLQVVIHHQEQIQMLKKFRSHKKIHAWLKLNTGMNRLGFPPTNTQSILKTLNEIDYLAKPIGLMTHFSDADNPNNLKTNSQWEIFQKHTKNLAGLRSLANSAAIIAFPEAHGDWVRPGIMLYGISPFAEKNGEMFGLKPVMTLFSKLIAIHDCRQGETIGYGSIFTCPEPMRIGVVAMGYGDGYPRNAESGTPVLVNNREVPLVGRVSMDMLTVDLRTEPHAQAGDPVILWGQGLPIERVARHSGTIAYELVCNINKRVYRCTGTQV